MNNEQFSKFSFKPTQVDHLPSNFPLNPFQSIPSLKCKEKLDPEINYENIYLKLSSISDYKEINEEEKKIINFRWKINKSGKKYKYSHHTFSDQTSRKIVLRLCTFEKRYGKDIDEIINIFGTTKEAIKFILWYNLKN
jgi:hypothetical protein